MAVHNGYFICPCNIHASDYATRADLRALAGAPARILMNHTGSASLCLSLPLQALCISQSITPLSKITQWRYRTFLRLSILPLK